MPRANHYWRPGPVWHLTHRCHRRQFLLRLGRDRRLWTSWLYEARLRHGLCVLDDTVTSHHVRLVGRDQGQGEVAARMQLLEGCTGQADSRRKRWLGAFWQDRYHATAVESGEHVARCVVSVDLNRVRAGVGAHRVRGRRAVATRFKGSGNASGSSTGRRWRRRWRRTWRGSRRCSLSICLDRIILRQGDLRAGAPTKAVA